MLGKFVLLIAASAVLSSELKVDVEDLLTLYERIDSEIKNTQHEVQIELRDVIIPMDTLLDDAAKYVMGNLTVAAEPYWTAIASMEAEAEAAGEDISVCVNAGNEELYALNETTVNVPLEKIAAYRREGNETLYQSSMLGGQAVEELLELEVQVKACSEPACAEELYNALIEFHGRAKEMLYEAVDNANTYLNELPEKLAPVNIDADDYKEKFTAILEAAIIVDIKVTKTTCRFPVAERKLKLIMLLKIAFFLAASATLALGLKSDLEALLTLYNTVDTVIKSEHREAQIEIRARSVPLNFYINQVSGYVYGNLSQAAEPYWERIASFEEQAEIIDRNITKCLDEGHSQFYMLNGTIIRAPISQLEACREDGTEIILASSSLSNSVISELLELEVEVRACSNNTCAQQLQVTLREFYVRGLQTIATAISNATDYVFEVLPQNLAVINIDRPTYTRLFNRILDQIKICIYGRTQ
ncbi:hypothetical protein HUJ05_002393 [Dendroctonus ponderosae]|nr:hypothetical protein HUJ05_002393 [Dendroctonus ponderosae]